MCLVQSFMDLTHIVVLQDGIGDSNDVWQVEIIGDEDGDVVHTVTSRMRLRHVNIGCYLHSHSTQLPKW